VAQAKADRSAAAKKAAAVPWRRDVGNWLYAVATRVARKARVDILIVHTAS